MNINYSFYHHYIFIVSLCYVEDIKIYYVNMLVYHLL